MAFIDIPTLDKRALLVSADSVSRVTRGIEAEGAGGLTRIDIGGNPHLTPMSAVDVVHLLRTARATMIELSAADGTQIFLAVGAIASVEDADAVRDPPNARSALMVAGRRQVVQQTRAEVKEALMAVS